MVPIITPKIRSSDTNMMTFAYFCLMSSHLHSHSVLPTDKLLSNMLSKLEHQINWFHSQIHTLTKFTIFSRLFQQFFSILLDYKIFSNCCFWLPYYISSKTHNLLFESFYMHLFISINSTRTSTFLIEIILIITIFFYMIVNYMKEEFVSPFLWILILSTTPNLKKSESL